MSQISLDFDGRNDEQLCEVLESLISLPRETQWIEFKCNFQEPQTIGEYISALSNSATLAREHQGWIVWGVEDQTHEVVGTSFSPKSAKGKGNEDLEPWLARLLDPRVNFTFHTFLYKDKPVVMLEVGACQYRPVRFSGVEYIRIGSHKKKLVDYYEIERKLWATLTTIPFERGVALERATGDQVLELLDYPTFFTMRQLPLPEGRNGIINRFVEEEFLVRRAADRFDITNLGAILFARDLRKFEGLKRKLLRIIVNKTNSRVDPSHEKPIEQGYASGFLSTVTYISDQAPPNEEIGALREDQPVYPVEVIRELLVNALGHQDFSMTGTGPMVEVFVDRIEFSNPGLPLIDVLRFIDHSPRSRNEGLAEAMRLLRMCDERGSGIDRVVRGVEKFHLSPPNFLTDSTHTRATIFARRQVEKMDRQERIRACYQHACISYVDSLPMTNATVRKRFDIEEKNYPLASRIISDTIEANLIKAADPDMRSNKRRYIPFWAT